MTKVYAVVEDIKGFGRGTYWIRDTDTYIDTKKGYSQYYSRFCETKKEFEDFVKENFNGFKSEREYEEMEEHWDSDEGTYYSPKWVRIDEIRYRTMADAQKACEWLNSSQILNKLAGV